MTKKTRNFYSIVIKADKDLGQVKVKTSPQVPKTNLDELQYLLNVLITGTDAGLKEMLGGLPVLRPASEVEREANVYVFKDEERDNALYKQRKALHDSIANVFNNTLKTLFPDIEYINSVQNHQQELVFDMSAEEAEEHQAEIQKIVEQVRNDDGKEDEEKVATS